MDIIAAYHRTGFPGGASGKEATCKNRRHKRCGFDLWIRKIPWRRAGQSILVFLPQSYGQRSLVGYGHTASGRTEVTLHAYHGMPSVQGPGPGPSMCSKEELPFNPDL